GWGATSFYSEFDAAGHLLLDGRIGLLGPPGTEADTYRAYRFEWRGEPTDTPAIVVEAANAYVSWNGATEVATWQLLGGRTREQMSVVASARKRTFEAQLPVPGDAAYVAVRALGVDGRVLAMSKTLQR
ncbi:MAG: arylsulfotransferase family protein, partial [Gaiellaceae bacterium]